MLPLREITKLIFQRFLSKRQTLAVFSSFNQNGLMCCSGIYAKLMLVFLDAFLFCIIQYTPLTVGPLKVEKYEPGSIYRAVCYSHWFL